ncbi:mechanosensitive ion channel [Pseudenhygromyxa sp. WMMC2535]|uniref:mechanosensitive ion channel family protein n=1 Tax=Pseudenhygromyxa sp. WMMC2535 TaxID=2712867 RepID=UPI0015536186|nr:mechanosensitive ion channel domain-containing protein [Pseudenhygromyxa sp. WMMC2535]NVB42617.1 mechanosensitive ion channel [Pseudenhygromyxa sp. WMMC2535]
MGASADVFINNAIALGVTLALTFVLGFVGTRACSRVLVPLLRRFDEREGVAEQRGAWASRVVVLISLLVGLSLVIAAGLLSWYELDASQILVHWIQDGLLSDPVAAAWVAGKLALALATVLVLNRVLRRAIPAAVDSLAGLELLSGRREALDTFLERTQLLVRLGLGLGAVVAVVHIVSESTFVRDPVVAVAYVVIGGALARAVVVAAHLIVEVLFELSGSLEERQTPLRFVSRLSQLTNVTKRVVEYFVYVGCATVVIGEVTPGTALAELGSSVIRVIGILYVARVIIEICSVAVNEWLAASPDASEAEQQQRQTLAPITTSLIRYAIYIMAISMALGELGLDASPILAAAGLMGIAVGLGAQTIVGDLVSGFFILFEGMFLVGHRVRVGEVLGVVEDIGVRVTKIRDEYGVLHAIPNGEIREVASHSQRYVNAVVEVGVPYEEDLPRVLGVLAAHLEATRERYPDIIGDSELRIEALRETCVWLEIQTPVRPGQDEDMSEALRLEVVTALGAAGVSPPRARHVVALEKSAG